MKFLLSLATALLFSLSALAAETTKPIELNLNGGAGQIQQDQTYSYDFGITTLNFPRYADFTLNSSGPGNLLVQDIGVAGIEFNAYHNCPGVMPAGTACTIRVRFNPWTEGFKTGRLVLRTSAGMIRIQLSGWGRRL